MRPLTLQQLTAVELPATDLVSLAGDLGCEGVSVFVHVPLAVTPCPPITPAMVPEMRSRLDATGVAVMSLEFFLLSGEEELESFRPAVEVGAQLGGRQLATIIYDTDQARATESLAGLCDLAAEHDLDVMLEFTGVTPGCSSVESAVGFLQRIDKPNAGLTVDPLHLVRTGGTPADVAAVPSGLIRHAQICDGPDLRVRDDYQAEIFERMAPGQGVFPLVEIFEAIPEGTPIDVEAPSASAQARGVPAAERAGQAVAAAREVLGRVSATG
jgi:sugar phosphate isomerase/epimerase